MKGNALLKFLVPAFIAAAAFVVAFSVITGSGRKGPEAPSESVYNWSSGDSYYSYASVTKTRFSFGGSAQDSEVKIDGVFHFKIFSVSREGIEAGFYMGPVSAVNSGSRDGKLEEIYSTPVLVRMGRDGSIDSYIFPAGADTGIKNTLKGLYSPLELILREGAKYNTVQNDAMGVYRAEYFRAGDRITRKRVRYTKGFQKTPIMDSTPVINSSECIFRPSEKGTWLESVYDDESVSYDDGSGKDVFRADINLKVKKMRSGSPYAGDPFTGKDFAGVMKAFQSYKIKKKPARQPEATAAKEQKTISAEDSLAEFRALLPGLGDRGNRDISLKMRAYLLENRDLISEIPVMLASGDFADHQAMELINILGIISVPEAQNALVEIASSSSQTDQNRFRAVMSFSSITAPLTQAAKTFLLGQLSGITNEGRSIADAASSILAVGVVSKNISKNYPEEADDLARDLISRLDASDNIQKKYLLKSIGNTGSDEYADVIDNYLKGSDPYLRRAAAESFKYMKGEEIQDMLAGQLVREPDAQVRGAIINSLAGRDVSKPVLDKVCHVAPAESNTDARRGMIEIIGSKLRKYPEKEKTLEQMLKNETSRVNIKRILKAIGNSRD